jgi:hypothetical protein
VNTTVSALSWSPMQFPHIETFLHPARRLAESLIAG